MTAENLGVDISSCHSILENVIRYSDDLYKRVVNCVEYQEIFIHDKRARLINVLEQFFKELERCIFLIDSPPQVSRGEACINTVSIK